MLTPELTTVFRSPRKRDCDERLLVLTAVGVAGVVLLGEGEFLLQVDPAGAPYALQHLPHYEAENRAPPPPPPPPYIYPDAWVGCVVYVLVLLGVAAALSHGIARLDAFDVGELDAARVPHSPIFSRDCSPRPTPARWAPRPRCSPSSGPCPRFPGASAWPRRSAGRVAGGRSSRASSSWAGPARQARGPTSSPISAVSSWARFWARRWPCRACSRCCAACGSGCPRSRLLPVLPSPGPAHSGADGRPAAA